MCGHPAGLRLIERRIVKDRHPFQMTQRVLRQSGFFDIDAVGKRDLH